MKNKSILLGVMLGLTSCVADQNNHVNYTDSTVYDTVKVTEIVKPNQLDINEKKPTDAVAIGENHPLIVYKKMLYTKNKETQFGLWEYWVTDDSDENFRLMTNVNYNVGDTLKISKK